MSHAALGGRFTNAKTSTPEGRAAALANYIKTQDKWATLSNADREEHLAVNEKFYPPVREAQAKFDAAKISLDSRNSNPKFRKTFPTLQDKAESGDANAQAEYIELLRKITRRKQTLTAAESRLEEARKMRNVAHKQLEQRRLEREPGPRGSNAPAAAAAGSAVAPVAGSTESMPSVGGMRRNRSKSRSKKQKVRATRKAQKARKARKTQRRK